MKKLETHNFSFNGYKNELANFETLLAEKKDLSEKNDILPFFQLNRNLSSQLATLNPKMSKIDKIAFEFDIFGDYACDLSLGDTSSNTYCFIEFEDARKNSLFVEKRGKFKPEFSPRLEHGYSQLIDWFYKIESLQKSENITERFGTHKIDYFGLLIIGRDEYLDASTKDRLFWRNEKVLVNSKYLYCYTFDEILNALKNKLTIIEQCLAINK